MNITINIYGDIKVEVEDCPCASCEDYNNYEDEYDELCDECKRHAEETEAPEAGEAPGVIVCSIDGMPENIPPEVVAAIADAAVSAVMEQFGGSGKGVANE